MKKLFYIAFIFVLTFPGSVSAQVNEKIEEAYSLYKGEDYDAAAVAINEAVEMNKGKTSKIAWHIRGFIYKDIYLHSDQAQTADAARDQAIISFKNSIKNDKDNSLDTQNRKTLKFLSISFFNEASEIIENRNPDSIQNAQNDYQSYRDLTLYLYPDSVMKDKDIDFFLAMSTANRKIYESDRALYEQNWQISNDYLMRVLDIDPKNWPANYSYAVLNYNKGAYNMERLPEVTNITDIYEIQAESMRSIEIALPYMMKAYEINPDKIEAVKGLRIILFNLNMEEESDQMRIKEKALHDSK